MNFGDQKTLTAEYLDDPNNSRHTSAALMLYLNRAQGDIKRHIDEANETFFQKTDTATVVAGDDDFLHTLPADFSKLVSVEDTSNSIPLQSIPTTFQDRHDSIRVDKRFLPKGAHSSGGYYLKHDHDLGRFRLGFTSPDSGYTVSILYQSNLDDMTVNADVSRVPSDYHDLMCLMAALRGYAIEQQRFPAGLESLRQEQLMQLRNYVEAIGRQQPTYINVQD